MYIRIPTVSQTVIIAALSGLFIANLSFAQEIPTGKPIPPTASGPGAPSVASPLDLHKRSSPEDEAVSGVDLSSQQLDRAIKDSNQAIDQKGIEIQKAATPEDQARATGEHNQARSEGMNNILNKIVPHIEGLKGLAKQFGPKAAAIEKSLETRRGEISKLEQEQVDLTTQAAKSEAELAKMAEEQEALMSATDLTEDEKMNRQIAQIGFKQKVDAQARLKRKAENAKTTIEEAKAKLTGLAVRKRDCKIQEVTLAGVIQMHEGTRDDLFAMLRGDLLSVGIDEDVAKADMVKIKDLLSRDMEADIDRLTTPRSPKPEPEQTLTTVDLGVKDGKSVYRQFLDSRKSSSTGSPTPADAAPSPTPAPTAGPAGETPGKAPAKDASPTSPVVAG